MRDVSKSFDSGTSFAVKNLSLTVAEGQTLALLGASGCGKTTTLKMINRLASLTSGQILVDERDIAKQNVLELRRSIGYVFQDIGLFPHMSVLDNAAIVPRLLGWDRAKRSRRAAELLNLVGLDPSEYADRRPRQLSGGQQQRVGIARALASDPKYLLMDEPFGALDAVTRDQLQEEVLRIRQTLGKTIVFVTHDLFEAIRLGDRIAVMNDGRLEQVGTKDELMDHPATDYVHNLISDLKDVAKQLRGGFTSEFMERPDGYPGLCQAYRFELDSTVDLDPGLMYQAVRGGQVDVICAFATDGRIAEYRLRVLEDDRHFFPPYDAAPIVRGELLRAHPEIRNALVALAGTIKDDQMRQMNRAVDVLKQKPADVVRRWLNKRAGQTSHESASRQLGNPGSQAASVWTLAVQRQNEIAHKTLQHLVLTVLGVAIAIALGIPMGIVIHRNESTRGPVLAATEVVQTIPSLAMLAFLFAVYGLLGAIPAVTALALYALLPIVLNTFTGLYQVPHQVIQAADGVGMSNRQRLWIVELPLAAPVMIAGIRASTVLTVGIATLCTYIGAGGLGDFIARGLARNDPRLTLLGAVPAAIMAVALSLTIRLIERLSCKS